MKKVLFNITGLLLFSSFSQAVSATEYQSELKNIVADEQFGKIPYDGTLTYNRDNKSLKLFIAFLKKNCPAGLMCTMEIPAPIDVELPIKSIEATSCGAKVIIAEKNLLPVDGDAKQIKLIDNSQNYCEYTYPLAPIEGEYTQSYNYRGSGMITLKAKFEGSALVKVLK